jgi:hypothetical protein
MDCVRDDRVAVKNFHLRLQIASVSEIWKHEVAGIRSCSQCQGYRWPIYCSHNQSPRQSKRKRTFRAFERARQVQKEMTAGRCLQVSMQALNEQRVEWLNRSTNRLRLRRVGEPQPREPASPSRKTVRLHLYAQLTPLVDHLLRHEPQQREDPST